MIPAVHDYSLEPKITKCGDLLYYCFFSIGIGSCVLENTGLTGNVSCGNHEATTCADCPQGNGASWCHGDCRWVDAGKFYSIGNNF